MGKILLNKKEFESLSLKSTFVITNLLESNVFDKIKLFQVDLVELIKKRISEISEKGNMTLKSFFDSKRRAEENNYEKTMTSANKNCDNLLKLVNENNKIFLD